MKKPVVAITGASGFVGQQLVQHFASQGWQVRALVRDPGKHTNTKRVQYIKYDLQRPVRAELLNGIDYLVHTAYIKFDRQHPEAFTENVQGSQRLYTAAKRAGVRKVLFLSTMSAHEEAISVYGKQKVAVEQIYTGEQAVILRSGLIVGNGGIVKEMVEFLRTKRVVPLVDGGHQPLQIIAVADLVQAIEQALRTDVTGTLTVANPHVYEYRELYNAVGRALHIKVIFVPVPFWLLLFVLRVASVLPITLPVSEDNLWGLKLLRAADNADDMDTLHVASVDLRTALEQSGIE